MSAVERALRIAEQHPDDLLTIVGPTASGKTALAVAIAQRAGGEVISADSVQIYRGFDVGSGKPTTDELALAPHHLVSAIEPPDHVDAASWSERACSAIKDVRARGRLPIVCGGTFLWVKALIYGLAEAPAANAELRQRHRAIAANEGRSSLHDRLREVDVESAKRLHPNDVVRVSRALEVFELTGTRMSLWQERHGFARARNPAKLIAIASAPAALTERIRGRVATWLRNGWVEEVQSLIANGFAETRPMGSVGYAQVRAMLAGKLPAGDIEEAIVRATRVFARKQRTWLTHAEVHWIDGLSPPLDRMR